jgi:hypothetical protein
VNCKERVAYSNGHLLDGNGRMGRDLAYDRWSCDLLLAASSPEVYRLNLEQVCEPLSQKHLLCIPRSLYDVNTHMLWPCLIIALALEEAVTLSPVQMLSSVFFLSCLHFNIERQLLV